MTKYDIIFEALQERVNSGELTLEDANIINDLAYEKYICEDKSDIQLKNVADNQAQKYRSKFKKSKRPVRKDFPEGEKGDIEYKKWLHRYDHGTGFRMTNRETGEKIVVPYNPDLASSEVKSARRRKGVQTADKKKFIDSYIQDVSMHAKNTSRNW